MAAISYKDLRDQYNMLGPEKMKEHLRENFASGALKSSDFSLQELAFATVEDGREWVQSMDPKKAGQFIEADAVNTATFSNITGQIIYNRILEDMTPEDYPFTQLIPTQSTQFDGEKIAGITSLGDEGETVAELGEYPQVGVTEDWIETPVTTKRGLIVPVSKEAIFFDRTNDVLRKAGAVSVAIAIGKEKRAIDCVIDENTTAHRYKWRGTTYATYQTTTPWDNVTASAALVDWTDIDEANQTLNSITDPNTGEPVIVEADTLICTKQLEMVALRIRNATEITVTTPGYATTGDPTETRVSNPLRGAFEVISTRQMAARAATDTTWIYGAPRSAFVYMENWPITVVQAPSNSEDEFKRDIVAQFKASERGAYATLNPRFVTECTA